MAQHPKLIRKYLAWLRSEPTATTDERERWLHDNLPRRIYERRAREHNNRPRCFKDDPVHAALTKAFYKEARRLTKVTGVVHHVHHIVPLKAKDENGIHVACGLHYCLNLRVVTAEENLTQNCRFNEDDASAL